LSSKGSVEYELDKFLGSIKDNVCYTQTIRVFVPTCQGKCTQAVKTLHKELTDYFEGSTMYESVRGCWREPDGAMICEPVKVIELGHNCATREDLQALSKAIVKYSQVAKQHSIGIQNGSFHITESKRLLERHLLESLKEETPG
jgi:hypothetical protein